ncbi:MAG TPA: DNA polymerase II large subunit [Candidatus Woesearchaeota archaeon]|nr:DNA polymerase II large subunit [Candidatus Woesearchaeota archaeon]
MKEYFEELERETLAAYKIASKARSKGYDPDTKPEVVLAKNLAERVIGLISVVAPQLQGSGAIKRIGELEKKYGILDWRVAFQIALEIAQEKFCKFRDKREAMEVGIRTGFAYVTLGAVSAPLEGFTKLEIKKRMDGKGDYFCLNFSGPIRAAGGTAAVVCVLIADYVRKKMGYAEYDPTEKEIKRCHAELSDYHEYVTNLQYYPSREEAEFLVSHVPVEISGDPSEKYEISNVTLKDLPRVNTNRIRSGYCLVYSAGLPLKAPKVWAKLSKWAYEFDLDHWSFFEEFLELQKKVKARELTGGMEDRSKKDKKESEKDKNACLKIKPDFTYISDLVAGRPVFGHPLANGAFRLRYGRSRTSGYSAQSIHPATMQILNDFIAIATQLKVERPGKAAAFTSCDTIEGPIVKLKDESVVYLGTEKQAKQLKNEIKEILYLGDVLINYGDFFDRAHPLVPAGYVPEEWVLELERECLRLFGTFDLDKLTELIDIAKEKLVLLFQKPLTTKISFSAAHQLSTRLGIPLHPQHIFFWNSITPAQLLHLLEWLKEKAELKQGERNVKIIIPKGEQKRILELIGLPHAFVNKEYVVIEGEVAKAFLGNLGVKEKNDFKNKEALLRECLKKKEKHHTTLELINLLSCVLIRDKCGTFIGARMGRPEKAKMRKLTGSPHVLFPVGREGGKFRAFQAALEKGQLTAHFAPYYCKHCRRETVFSICEVCDRPAEKMRFCKECGLVKDCPHEPLPYKTMVFNIKESFPLLLKKIGTNIFPDLIKGVRGTSNKEHIPEHLIKGILRAKHKIHVNKDGTIRYDCSEIPLTHFKPREIGVGVEKLRQLGYTHDINGEELNSDEQVLELKPQDILLPCSRVSPEEPADEVLFRTACFVDELLEKFYGLKPYYNLRTKEELVGHLVIGLAPHTSAGILCRIIGFSRTQGFVAHPYVHAAMRRDCDGDEGCLLLLMDALLNFSKKYLPSSRGSTMDAPLVLTYLLNPAEVDDMVFNMDVAWKYPLEFYEACRKYKMPWEVRVKQVAHVLGTPHQYSGLGFTHNTTDINQGVLCSAYKLLPSMEDKLKGQMELAEKIRAVDTMDVARLVIDKHFMKDTKGNLRKFSQQEFRCVDCNQKFRRPPLSGKCSECGGKIIFTVSEGFVIKYLELSMKLAEKYNVPVYMKQTLELLKQRVESVFGKEKERQQELGAWLNS